MGETDWGGNWVLFWWVGPCSVYFNPFFCWWVELCSLPVITWGQTVVEVMKITAASLERSHSCSATLSAPNPAAGHCQPAPLQTPGHSRANLGQSLVGPGSWCTQGSVCTLQESMSPILCKLCSSMVGLMATSSKSAYATPKSAAPKAPAPAVVHYWPVPPQEALRHNSVSVSVGSLGPGACKICLGPLSISGGYGIWF